MITLHVKDRHLIALTCTPIYLQLFERDQNHLRVSCDADQRDPSFHQQQVKNGPPGRIRTCDKEDRSLLL